MTKYFHDNFDWDLGKYLMEIEKVTNSVYDSIKRFAEFLTKEEKEAPNVEIIEVYGSGTFDKALSDSLSELFTDLKNQSFHNSLILTVYSYLEYSLLEFCRLVDLYVKPKARLKDITEKGIDKCKEYLKSNFDLNISDFKEWQNIKDFQKIRNLIAHNNSNLYKEPGMNLVDQPDHKTISTNKNIRISESGTIFIKNISYISSLADCSVSLINYTITKVREKSIIESETNENQ
jgi:hypothetical protein